MMGKEKKAPVSIRWSEITQTAKGRILQAVSEVKGKEISERSCSVDFLNRYASVFMTGVMDGKGNAISTATEAMLVEKVAEQMAEDLKKKEEEQAERFALAGPGHNELTGMLSLDQQLNIERRKLWMDAVVAYTASSNSSNKAGAARWADQVLEDFDARFKIHDYEI